MRLTEYQETIVRRWAAEHFRKGLPVAEAALRCSIREGTSRHVGEVVADVYRALEAREGAK